MDEQKRKNLNLWLAQTANGDTRAFEELYRAASAGVYAFALSILKNRQDAEDAAQDCFVRVYASAGQYRREQNPMAWILTIAKNICLRRLSERGREQPTELWDTQREGALSPETSLILKYCMDALGDEERRIVTLHAVAGLKHREIAALLEIPLSTALSKYNRAMKKLKIMLREED